MKEMNVYTLCRVRRLERKKDSFRLGRVGSLRTKMIQNVLSSEQDWLLMIQRETTKMDLTDTSATFAATQLVEGFRFLDSKGITGEKKRDPQDELVIDSL